MALTDKLTAIGDAIRGKTGGSAQLSLTDMATSITNLSIGTPLEGNIETKAITLTSGTYASAIFGDIGWNPSSYANWIFIFPVASGTSSSQTVDFGICSPSIIFPNSLNKITSGTYNGWYETVYLNDSYNRTDYGFSSYYWVSNNSNVIWRPITSGTNAGKGIYLRNKSASNSERKVGANYIGWLLYFNPTLNSNHISG